jgi:hypothetical protein
LANGKAFTVRWKLDGKIDSQVVPASHPGLSQENTWESSLGCRRMLEPFRQEGAKEAATPGLKAQGGMPLLSESFSGNRDSKKVSGRFSVTPSVSSPQLSLVWTWEKNWSSSGEVTGDAISLHPWEWVNGIEFNIPIPTGYEEGLFRYQLVWGRESEFYSGLSMAEGIQPPSHSPLEIGSACVDPGEGESEWVEVRNRSQTRLGPLLIQLQGKDLPDLIWEPGESLFLKPASPASGGNEPTLNAGRMEIEIPQWPGLRNTQDTLRIRYGEKVLDSLLFPESWKGFSCRQGSAGATRKLKKEGALKLGTNKVTRRKPLEWKVTLSPGQNFQVHLFDAGGKKVRHWEGTTPYAGLWDGTDGNGRRLPTGLFALELWQGSRRLQRNWVGWK